MNLVDLKTLLLSDLQPTLYIRLMFNIRLIPNVTLLAF